jgi:hypothetical protein
VTVDVKPVYMPHKIVSLVLLTVTESMLQFVIVLPVFMKIVTVNVKSVITDVQLVLMLTIVLNVLISKEEMH